MIVPEFPGDRGFRIGIEDEIRSQYDYQSANRKNLLVLILAHAVRILP